MGTYSNLLNKDINIYGYVDGITDTRLVLTSGVVSSVRFANNECCISISDSRDVLLKKPFPFRSFSEQDGFSNTSKDIIDDLPQASRPIPLVYGQLSGPGGIVPTVYYDNINYRYAVAGHTIKAVDDVFVEGATVTAGFTVNLGTTGPDGGILSYIDFDSDQKSSTITCNARGAVDIDGKLISNPCMILQDILSTAGLTSGQIDSQAFSKAIQLTDGLTFSGIVGANGFEDLNNVVSNISLSMNGRSYFNYENKFSIRVLDVNRLQSPSLYLDIEYDFKEYPDILHSFLDYGQGIKTYTKIIVQHAKNFQKNKYTNIYTKKDDLLLREYNLSSHVTAKIESNWINTEYCARWLSDQFFTRFYKPPYVVTGTLFLDSLNADIGDVVCLSRTIDDPTSERYSWKRKLFEVVRIGADFVNGTVDVSLLEI